MYIIYIIYVQNPSRCGCYQGGHLKHFKAPTSNQNIINTKINLHSQNPIPFIMISADGRKNPARMIDTEARRNLIKLNILEKDIEINQNGILRLTRINNVPVYTLGQIILNIFGYPTIFNLTPNSVPVKENGVNGEIIINIHFEILKPQFYQQDQFPLVVFELQMQIEKKDLYLHFF